MLVLVGVTFIDKSVAAVTVKVVVPVMAPVVAVTVMLPISTAVPSPCEPAALLTVATELSDDDHVVVAVRSWVVLSVYVPVAVNCWVVPFALVGFVGVTLIETSVAAVTVKFVEPFTAPDVAVIVTVPLFTAEANP